MQDERNVNATADNAANASSERAVRREKLANLQSAGMDPFVTTKYEVSHHSTVIKENYAELEGKEVSIGGRMRMTRTNMLEVLNSDYIRTARAKGLSENSVVYKHVFRNTLIPLVTSLAGLLPSLFS